MFFNCSLTGPSQDAEILVMTAGKVSKRLVIWSYENPQAQENQA